jgi:hypothetical protein
MPPVLCDFFAMRDRLRIAHFPKNVTVPPSRRARSFQCDAFKRARIVFCDLDLPRCWALAFFDPGHA